MQPHIFEIHASLPPIRRRAISSSLQRVVLVSVALTVFGALAFGQRFDPDAAFLPSPVRTVSTVPPNGDGNPYGVAFIPGEFLIGTGPLRHGDILVSNFNNGNGLQGTGTTIVRVPRKGAVSVFFQGTAPLGLTTALGTLRSGLVVVGNGPTSDGTFSTATPGSLLVINNQGVLIQTITDPTIQYPWDMALIDRGDSAIAFVTNALNGTVTRLKFHVYSWGLKLESAKVIASGYVNRGDPVALFVAPTGLVYDERHDLLYVASTGDNAVFVIQDAAERKSDAGIGQVVYQDNVHLHGALGLIEAPNGHLLVSNNDGINPDPNQPSEIVEFTKQGEFVKEISVDPAFGGAFGMAVRSLDDKAIFAAVDDNTNSLIIWTLSAE